MSRPEIQNPSWRTEFLGSVYNGLLSQVDTAYNEFSSAEDTVADISERMLAGIAARFGKDSNEYEQAGGVKKSDRKKPLRKAPVAVTNN